MSTDIRDYIRNINNLEWKSLQEEGVETSGIFVKSL
jgi:hypothetical protein